MLSRKGPSGPTIDLASYPSPGSTESGSATTIDWSDGPVQRLTLTATCQIHVTGLPAGESVPSMRLELTQGVGGSKLALIVGAKTPGGNGLSLSSPAGALDLVDLCWDGFQLFALVVALDCG